MEIKVKEVEELVREGLVSNKDLHTFPDQFVGTVAIIFPGKSQAIDYCRSVLLPKVGASVLTSLWSCLTEPARVESVEKGNYGDGLAQMLGIKPDEGEKWLLFKKEDFEKYIKPVM